MIIKDIIPPILTRFLQSNFLFKVQITGNYKNYQEAAATCKGYEDKEVVNVIYEKTRNFRKNIIAQNKVHVDTSILQTILGLCLAVDGKNLNVIDFGGGFGHHFHAAKAILGDKINIKWCVVETTSMVRQAESLANDELFYCDNIKSAINKLDRVDIVFSSSTLQYLEDPYLMLNTLMGIEAKYLFIMRVPLLVHIREIYAIQRSKFSSNGPGALPSGMKDGIAEYPINLLSKDKLEKAIEKKYNIKLMLDYPDPLVYRLKEINLYGLFCTIKPNDN